MFGGPAARTRPYGHASAVADAQLRVWSPQGAQVLFIRQVAPTVEDLTDRRVEVNP